MKRARLALLISGRGSNMAAILDAAGPDYPAEPVLVLSNRADAAGLGIAAARGVPSAVVESRAFKGDRAGFEAAMEAELAKYGVEIIALAGFMRVLTAEFVRRWEGRLINIHPSLLPAFPGLDTHARALAAGVRLHGCTVHLVTAGVDEGPIIAQAAVPVLPNDTEASLAARVLAEEHQLYPAALSWLAAGRVRLEAGRAVITGAEYAPDSLLNPLPRAALLSTQKDICRDLGKAMAEKEHYDFVEVTSADILADRRGGWEGFTRFVTWSTGATVLVLVLMAIFLV